MYTRQCADCEESYGVDDEIEIVEVTVNNTGAVIEIWLCHNCHYKKQELLSKADELIKQAKKLRDKAKEL